MLEKGNLILDHRKFQVRENTTIFLQNKEVIVQNIIIQIVLEVIAQIVILIIKNMKKKIIVKLDYIEEEMIMRGKKIFLIIFQREILNIKIYMKKNMKKEEKIIMIMFIIILIGMK